MEVSEAVHKRNIQIADQEIVDEKVIANNVNAELIITTFRFGKKKRKFNLKNFT